MSGQKSDIEIMEGVITWFEDPSHWTKNAMNDCNLVDGVYVQSTCLLGAIQLSEADFEHSDYEWETPSDAEGGYTPLEKIVKAVVIEQFPERVDNLFGMEVSDFNDDANTNIEDVRLVCEKTLAYLREQA